MGMLWLSLSFSLSLSLSLTHTHTHTHTRIVQPHSGTHVRIHKLSNISHIRSFSPPPLKLSNTDIEIRCLAAISEQKALLIIIIFCSGLQVYFATKTSQMFLSKLKCSYREVFDAKKKTMNNSKNFFSVPI